MIVTHLKLKNWRNFRDVDIPLHERTYLLGANATGKSNLLDVFRFLRDISKPQGGGLQKAVKDRGGIPKLRCLHARRHPEVRIELNLEEEGPDPSSWIYTLAFKPEGKGAQRLLVSEERVLRNGVELLNRPDDSDLNDAMRLTETALEQVQANAKFRELATFLGQTTYLHLVPQLLKYGDEIGGKRLDDDPFGQGLLERIAHASPRNREARLNKIGKALAIAVPRFVELRFMKDPTTGRPHLEARYTHFRPNAGWQREDQFSDGTLRLLGLLWSLLESDSLLLLEEPELSLNDAIVREIPLLLQRALREAKRRRQVIVSTHSEALLSNPGIDKRGLLLLEPGDEGSTVRPANEEEIAAMDAGLSAADVLLPKARPSDPQELGRW